MRTSDEIGRTTTNKTSNTEHLLHGDHQIFKYFTGPPMESAKGTTTESNNNQPKRKKQSTEGRKRSKKKRVRVNLKKITQGQNRHYIRIKYYFIFTYYYKMKILFSSFCYKIIIIFLVYINFCNRN